MDRFDIGRALKAPFDDAEWMNKTLLGFVWSLLVVTAPAVYGAQLEYTRRVAAGNETLPEWDDFGTKWVEGLLVGIAGFLYFLPVLILGAVLVAPAAIAAAGSGGDSDAIAALVGGGTCVFTIVAMVYGVGMSIFFSAAMTHYAMTRSFGAFFRFGEIMAKVRGGTGYFTAWLYVLLISVILSTVSSFVSGLTGGLGAIVMPAVSYLAAMMMGHVMGQWARVAYAVAPGAGSGANMPAAGYVPDYGPAQFPPPPPPAGDQGAYQPYQAPASQPVPPAPPAPEGSPHDPQPPA